MSVQTDLPPPIQMLHLIVGKWVSQAVYAVATLGVADQLAAGPKPPDALAKAVGAHAPSLHRVLRALASIGVFTEDAEGRFALTPLGETLRSDVPGSMRAFARFLGMPPAWDSWREILHSVKTGENGFEHVHGQTGFEYFSTHPEEAALFDAAMVGFSQAAIPTLLASYDFAQFGTIVDVAGGRGHVLAAILQAHPRARGILFDMPHVVEGAKRHLAAEGVADRCEVVAGDFFRGVPAGADAYLLKHIIHDWDDPRCEAILGGCRQAIAKTGKLLVIEMVIPPGNQPFFGKLLDLEMLVLTPGGKERTEAEYRALFRRAGFELARVVPTQSPVSVLEATPA
jgi:hypothetical protein